MSFPARSMTSEPDAAAPKLTPEALAKAIVNALKDALRTSIGDVAQEWLARWEESPRLEREVAMSAERVNSRASRMTENPLVSLAADLLSDNSGRRLDPDPIVGVSADRTAARVWPVLALSDREVLATTSEAQLVLE